MIVTPLSLRETIEWFELRDRQHEICCFLLTADPKDRAILAELVQGRIDADVALGERVAFVLFGGDMSQLSEVDTRQGVRTFLVGQALQPMALRRIEDDGLEGPAGLSTAPNRLDERFVKRLADDTAQTTTEWLALLGLERRSLPALCVLVKGSDPAVIRLGDTVDTSQVLRVFGRLADIAERIDAALELSFEAEDRMDRALALSAQIDAEELALKRQLEALCHRYKANPEDVQRIAQFLTSNTPGAAALDAVLAECQFAADPDFDANTTVKGARNAVRKLEETYAQLQACKPEPQLATSLADAIKHIEQRRLETQKFVAELVTAGMDAKQLDRKQLGMTYDKYAARINQTATLLEKGAKFVALVKGLTWLKLVV